MGSSRWADEHFQQRQAVRAATNTPTFAFHQSTASKPRDQQKAHDTLNPLGVKMRESRDSDAHPESRAIATLLDVTGSMGGVPRIIQANLPKLMGLLMRKGYVEHPQIMVGAIGDVNTDSVPLQVGQFESGIEIENDITNLFLEGGGGGQVHESYELALYFMARHTSIDCWEKRQQKGYLFLTGDEMAYDPVKPAHVEAVIGDKIEAAISLEAILAEVSERYEVFFILPRMTSYFDNKEVRGFWRKHLGERLLLLDEPDAVCELIASTIGLCESGDLDATMADLADAGTDAARIGSVKNALATLKPSGKLQNVDLADSGAAAGVGSV